MIYHSASKKLRPLARRLYWAVSPAVHGKSRPPHVVDRTLALPFNFDVTPVADAPRICVICHLFYDDLANEIQETLQAIPYPFDLFVSTSDDAKRTRIESAFSHFSKGRVEVRVAPNRGRDIAPKLVTFRDIYADYDYVFFIHGKKSAKSSVGQQWRDTLIGGLLGSPATVRNIVGMFKRYPTLGIVMAQHFEPIRPHLHWDHVFGTAKALARRMGFEVTPQHVIDFPSGSMFWARTAALAPLLSLELDYADFPDEAGQTRRTLHHAIERLFLFAAEKAGFTWIKVADPHYYSATHIENLDDLLSLDDFIDQARFDLLRSDRR